MHEKFTLSLNTNSKSLTKIKKGRKINMHDYKPKLKMHE